MYHFIYPSKDTYIYELNTNSEKNFGADDTLVLKKEFDGKTGLKGVSRVLLQFDLSDLSSSLKLNEHYISSSNTTYKLRLFEHKTSELSTEYKLAAYPLSSSWEEGSGYAGEDPNSKDGASWEKTNENFTYTSWSLLSGEDMDTSGSRPKAGGGVWMSGSNDRSTWWGGLTQTFSYESPDVNMDISQLVKDWLGSTPTYVTKIKNNGLILKWSGSQEDSTDISGDINFHSRHGNPIYSPRIDIMWDDHIACSGSNTGSLTQLTIDGKKDNYLYMINLRDTYRETEIPKFRVGGRERYQTKSTSTTKSLSSTMFVPEGSGSYSIIDVETGQTLIPFGSNSLLSCDSKSNYFKQKLNGFITNRLYRIKLRLQTDDNKKIIYDNGFDFKVIK